MGSKRSLTNSYQCINTSARSGISAGCQSHRRAALCLEVQKEQRSTYINASSLTSRHQRYSLVLLACRISQFFVTCSLVCTSLLMRYVVVLDRDPSSSLASFNCFTALWRLSVSKGQFPLLRRLSTQAQYQKTLHVQSRVQQVTGQFPAGQSTLTAVAGSVRRCTTKVFAPYKAYCCGSTATFVSITIPILIVFKFYLQ